MSLKDDMKHLRDFIASYKYFFVIGHENPDGDCIGSQVACASLLKKLGKQTCLLSSGPFTDVVANLYKPLFVSSPADIAQIALRQQSKDAAVICVDTSSSARLGEAFAPVADLPAAVIDHHSSGNAYGTVRYIDPSAPANTLLVYRLFQECKITPSREDAHFLLLGILTDTQFFRFVDAKNTEAFITAGKMVDLGVSPGEIYQQIGFGFTFLSRKVLSKILDRAFRVNNNRVIITYLRYDDYLYKDDMPQSYEIYQLLQGTQKTEVVVYIQESMDEESRALCKVGLRSHSKVDVAQIAHEFGGGGHKRASGFTMREPLDKTIAAVGKYFDELAL